MQKSLSHIHSSGCACGSAKSSLNARCAHFHGLHSFPDITQGLSRNPGIKNEENAVESTSPTTGSSTSDVSKQAASTVDNRPSLELSADALVTMESSNTPPSMADWKKVSPNKASSPPWSPGNSGKNYRVFPFHEAP